jgi:hypothetical protein
MILSANPGCTLRARLVRSSVAMGSVAAAIAWLVLRAAPPPVGRALFGLWRVPDVALAAALLIVAALASCRSRRAKLRLATAAASATLVWFAVELVFLTCVGVAAPKILGKDRLPSCDLKGETVPDVAARFGLPCRSIPFHYTTNALGYRNLPDRDVGAVYCVGDSCLVSAPLAWPETPVQQLEELSGRRCVSVALIGLSPQEAQAEFAHAAAGLDLHGCVVLQFLCEDNDLVDSARLTAVPCHSLYERSLLCRLVNGLQRWTQAVVAEAGRRTALFGDTPVMFLWLHRQGDPCEQQWPNIERSLDEFRAAVEARGGSFGVVLIPQKLRVLGPFCGFPPDSDLLPIVAHLTPMPQRLAEWSRRTGGEVLDLTDALQAAARAGHLVWFADDTHWNAAGAATAAAAVASWPWFCSMLRDQDEAQGRSVDGR